MAAQIGQGRARWKPVQHQRCAMRCVIIVCMMDRGGMYNLSPLPAETVMGSLHQALEICRARSSDVLVILVYTPAGLLA